MSILSLLLPLLLSCSKPEQGLTIPLPPDDYKPGVTDPDPPTPDPPSTDPSAVTSNIIVGYATYWDSRMPDPTLLTHINYSFAHIKDDFESLDIKKESRLSQIAALKNSHPGLKVLLSVGGWEAGNFSEMAADPTHRQNFCNNCLAAVNRYRLDGIDLDWEYPTSGAAGISYSPDDTKNFTLLLKDLRNTLGENRLITMASAANAKYVDFRSAIAYLDFVNIMTYDMGKPPYHNAGLYESSMTKRSCDQSVTAHYNAGVPYSKIVLGIPFYGHGDGSAFSSDCVDYNEIKTDGYTVRWDQKALVPYLVDASGKMVLSYDDETSVGLKADFVKQKGLLGAMYWNIEADDADWTLSRAIASRLLPGYTAPEEETILVTNPYVQKYMEEVSYPDNDYTYSLIKNYPGGGPGEADIPPSVTLTWAASSSDGALKLRISDEDWSRTYSLTAGTTTLDVSNLVPGSRYTWIVTASNGTVLKQDSFLTSGALHQVYFTNKVRNARDLGGWKTTDGKTVRFRKLYRGGRVDSKYMDSKGCEEALAQGIRAELDLREAEDVPKASYFGSSMPFCAPGFESGYRSMLRDRAVGVKECFEFIVNCLREDKPVYFHCAAGRDRTGTIALLCMGVLGVREGDLGKDYELTYFSPADWSMYNGDYHHMRTASGSYLAALEYIKKFGTTGNDFKTCAEKYLLSIGIQQKDIDDFRSIMLR